MKRKVKQIEQKYLTNRRTGEELEATFIFDLYAIFGWSISAISHQYGIRAEELTAMLESVSYPVRNCYEQMAETRILKKMDKYRIAYRYPLSTCSPEFRKKVEAQRREILSWFQELAELDTPEGIVARMFDKPAKGEKQRSAA